jgi:hypothetical protein
MDDLLVGPIFEDGMLPCPFCGGRPTLWPDRITLEVSGVTTRSEATQAARPLDRNVMRLAALFVQPSGCYADLPGIDAWPEQRDARRYAGPLPVVAHPPCQLWGAMAAVNYARWGGEHNKPGNDGGCFAAALEACGVWRGARTPGKNEGMGSARTGEAGWDWLAAHHRWRVGVRGLAERLRAPREQSDMALLPRHEPAV